MPHFFINSNSVKSGVLTVEDLETLKHFAILRVKTGETVKFIDENGIQYFTKTLEMTKNKAVFEVLKAEKSIRKLDFDIYLAQSVLKTDAENLLIANACELGIKWLYPFISDFSTVKADFAVSKREKWQKIADEAFKQCERADRMQVFEVLSLENIVKNFKKENIIVFAEKYASCSVFEACREILAGEKILVITGPEGGFSEKEFEFFKSQNFKLVTLGDLIFKAPNAVTAGCSNVIMSLNLLKGNTFKDIENLKAGRGGLLDE